MKQNRLLFLNFSCGLTIMVASHAAWSSELQGAALPASNASPNHGSVGVLVSPGMGPEPSNVSADLPSSLPPPVPPVSPVMSNGLYRVGTNLTGAGFGAMIGGGVFILLGNVMPCELGETGCDQDTYDMDQDVGAVFVGFGVGFLIAGGVAALVGIPLWIAGHHQVKRELESPRAALRPELQIGAQGVGFRF